jgi:bacterioferritin
MPHFVRDIQEIRQRAIHKMEDGAVTESYKGDVNKTIEILNEALATEIVCVLRYMHHYFMATGVHGTAARDEFKEHADDEREHADLVAERIQQLGGKPDFNPKSLLERSASQYIEGESLADMIREDLIAERIVIEMYQGMIRYFGDNDPTTRVMLERLLTDEEDHASDLTDLLYIVNPETGRTEGEDPGTDVLHMHGQHDGGRSQVRSTQASSGTGRGQQSRVEEQPQTGREDYSKERDRILKELRSMGKNKKPAA